MARVFDQPTEIGEPVWTFQWRDSSDWGDRGFVTMMATLLLGFGTVYGLHYLIEITAGIVIAILVVFAIGSWIFFGPDRHCYCAGTLGASISRQRFGCWTTRDVLRYDEADDIELDSTRIVSDAVGQIYERTTLSFSFMDKEGYEVFAIPGEIDEPEQRAEPKYNPTAPLQLDGPTDHGAKFGFATMDAFRAFKDQRPGGVYR